MVELIVVLILVGILGAIGASRFFDGASFDVPTQAEQVRAMLRYAQKSAIARNTFVYVRFEENRISLCGTAPSGACAGNAQIPSPGGFYAADDASRSQCGAGSWYCLGKPSGVTWSRTPAPDWIRFDALGRPLLPSGGAGALSFTISSGRDSTSISVAEETGYVQ